MMVGVDYFVFYYNWMVNMNINVDEVIGEFLI